MKRLKEIRQRAVYLVAVCLLGNLIAEVPLTVRASQYHFGDEENTMVQADSTVSGSDWDTVSGSDTDVVTVTEDVSGSINAKDKKMLFNHMEGTEKLW